MTDDVDLDAWLRLLLTPGVGRETARRLMAAFGPPDAVLAADPVAVAQVAGMRVSEALRERPPDLTRHADATRRWLAGGDDRTLLMLGDAAYPRQLLEAPDPPLLLYVRGHPAHLSRRSVAIVGSRRPTAQGLDHARDFSRRIAEAGHAVVSGLAQGIDAAAHSGALDAGGVTIAVVGTGIDRVYPRQHLALAQRIAEQGALVSEYLPETPPLAENFPQRNRIIAGLSQGTLVVEAALRSGSLITARLANEAGRDVFAVPGSIRSEQSRGCHALLRDGAQLVEHPDDVLAALGQPMLPGMRAPSPADPAPAVGDAVLDALGHDPVDLDALLARTGQDTAVLLARLLELELEGSVARLPGGLYQRRGRA